MSRSAISALEWRIVRRGRAVDYRVLAVRQHTADHPPTGKRGLFTVIELPDWVNVIALTADDRVVMVRQFRHGTGRLTLEIPGGTVDPGETPRAAARRELQEETGYRAGRMVRIGSVEPNPAIQTNRCHTFLATDVRPGPPSAGDPEEVIAVETVPLHGVPGLLSRGRITHALVVAAFAHLVRVAGGFRRPGDRVAARLRSERGRGA